MTGGQYDRNFSNNNQESPCWRSNSMIEYIVKTDKIGITHTKVKFHAPVKQFRRVEIFKFQGRFYKVLVDKNDSVYGLLRTEVTSWKDIVKGKKKFRVPDVCEEIPEPNLFNRIKGNPFKIAIGKIMTEIERESI